jgi:hypothetical protein
VRLQDSKDLELMLASKRDGAGEMRVFYVQSNCVGTGFGKALYMVQRVGNHQVRHEFLFFD